MTVPLACSLGDVDARAQLLEWRQFVSAFVERCDRVAPTRTELLLGQEPDLAALADLAQRETRCCPFFHFALELGATSVVLSIEVPGEAASILESFSDEISAGPDSAS